MECDLATPHLKLVGMRGNKSADSRVSTAMYVGMYRPCLKILSSYSPIFRETAQVPD